METRTRGYHPKIDAMKRGQEFREQLREMAEKNKQIRRDNFDFFHAAMDQLKAVDPEWESWYEDCVNIPEQIIWLDAKPVIQNICDRILSVSGVPFTWERKRERFFSWEITRQKAHHHHNLELVHQRGICPMVDKK
jgi:hypothetical protein